MFANIKDLTKWVVIAFGLGVIVFLFLQLKPLFDPKPVVQPAGTSLVPSLPSIPHGSPKLPQPDAGIAGVLKVAVSDTVKAADTIGTVHRHVVEIYIPDDGHKQPSMASSLPVEASFTSVRDPYVLFGLDFFLGASVNDSLRPSPIGMVSFVSIVSTVRLGVAVDRSGAGPALAAEFYQQFNLIAKWNVARIEPNRWSLGVAYRF